MITFNNLEEMQPYYDEDSNTYIFAKDGERLDITINFDLRVKSRIYSGDIDAYNINSGNIDAYDITADDINARNIDAGNIDAGGISYYAICTAYSSFKCKSVSGRRPNNRHICLDNDIVFKEESQDEI